MGSKKWMIYNGNPFMNREFGAIPVSGNLHIMNINELVQGFANNHRPGLTL